MPHGLFEILAIQRRDSMNIFHCITVLLYIPLWVTSNEEVRFSVPLLHLHVLKQNVPVFLTFIMERLVNHNSDVFHFSLRKIYSIVF